MSDWSTGAAGAGLAGLALTLGYAGVKLLKRSRCASHTGCCDLDISRAETERKEQQDMRNVVLAILQEHLSKKDDVRLDVAEKEPGEKEESYVQYHVPPSAM